MRSGSPFYGEIDIICRPSLLDDPAEAIELFGHPVLRERPAEIVAKKIRYRGGRFQPRDVFDLAAVLRAAGLGVVPGGRDGLLMDLEPLAEFCPAAIRTIRDMAPAFMERVMGQLILRPAYSDLQPTAASDALAFLIDVAARAR